jgi:hypothetical protein
VLPRTSEKQRPGTGNRYGDEDHPLGGNGVGRIGGQDVADCNHSNFLIKRIKEPYIPVH